MWLVPSFAALTFATAGLGCTSTLDDYLCQVAADCSGEMPARCESGGHCSFEDEACASGYRFGKNSGEDSLSCVGPDGLRDSDAGPITGPVAIIGDFEMPCEQTSGVFDGTLSTTIPGETLTNFEWQLRAPNGALLDQFEGPPGGSVLPDIHRLGGTLTRPRLNATTYEGRQALMVDLQTPSAEGGLYLYTELPLDGFSDTSQGFQISFALGTTTEATGGEFVVVDSTDQVIESRFFEVGNGMQPYYFEVNLSALTFSSPPFILAFGFGQAGTYWVDNVSLVETDSSSQLVTNGSVEETASTWRLGSDSLLEDTEASSEEIPESFRQTGRYTLRLRVTDSDGEDSAFDEITFDVAECFGP